MDASVNHGTGRAAKFLQKAVMVEQDGAIGPRTIMAVNDNEPTEIISRMAVYRDAFYRSLSTFDTFGEGWIRRNDETRTSAIALGRG
jgi:lysozyme family protein